MLSTVSFKRLLAAQTQATRNIRHISNASTHYRPLFVVLNGTRSQQQQQQQRLYSTGTPAASAAAVVTPSSTSTTVRAETPLNENIAASIQSEPLIRSSTNHSTSLHDQIKDLDKSLETLSENTFEQAENLTDTILHYISPARYLEEFLTLIHEAGLPWWAAIATSAFLARMAMYKLNVNMTKFAATKSAHMNEEKALMTKMRNAKNPEDRVEYASAMKEFKKKHGLEDWRMFQSFLQFPVFITFLYTLRQMAQTNPSLMEGGFLWFHDLSQVDPYYLLPIISALLQLTSFEIGQLRRFQPPGTVIGTPQKIMKYFIRTITLGSIFFTRYFPAAMFMYWIPSNIFQILFTFITKTDWFRQRYNIPDPNSFARGTQNQALNKHAEAQAKQIANKILPSFLFKKLYPVDNKVQKAYTQEELKQLKANSTKTTTATTVGK